MGLHRIIHGFLVGCLGGHLLGLSKRHLEGEEEEFDEGDDHGYDDHAGDDPDHDDAGCVLPGLVVFEVGVDHADEDGGGEGS